MSVRRLRLDLLKRRLVRDADGAVVGRIHEVVVERKGDEMVIVEYHLGPAALLERIGMSMRSAVGFASLRPSPIRVPWEKLDLSDPDRPIYLG